jgi:integrase
MRVRESACTNDPAEARRLLRQRLGEIADGRFIGPLANKVTFEELAEGLFWDYEVNGKKSLKWVRIKVKKHLAPFFADRKARDITTADVEAYVLKRQREKASNGEINRELSALKRMFSLGIRAEKILRRPYIPRLEERNIRKGFFEIWDFQAVLAKLPDYLCAPITFAFWSGWRKSEILSLTWQQVDFEAGSVKLPVGSTKNGDGRTLYFVGELKAHFEKWWAEHLSLFPSWSLVFHRGGRRIKDPRGAWARACEEAALSGRIPHDFRRTAVRNMVRAGIPERVAMAMTGHKTRDVFDRYNIVSDGDLRDAARKLDQRLSLQMGTTSVTTPEIEVVQPQLTH